MLALTDRKHVLDQPAVLELDALRRGRRARRVEDVGDVVGRDGPLAGSDLGIAHGYAEVPERRERRDVGGACVEGDDPIELGKPVAYPADHREILLAAEPV